MDTAVRSLDRSVDSADPDAFGALTGWAAAEAEAQLNALPEKWLHTRKVADHARWAAAGVRPDDRDVLVAAAYLHDIGCADGVVDSGFHALDGARYLRRYGLVGHLDDRPGLILWCQQTILLRCRPPGEMANR